jgi:two-component system, NarL family, invasion response regulator UvrY
VNILTVDSHVVVRRGIRAILADELPGAVIAEAGAVDDALQLLASATWHLVILDIQMPDRDGLDVLPQIHASYPDTPVLVLSAHTEEQYAVRALRAGAVGYITKDSAVEELVAAMHKALAGGMYLTARLAEALARGTRKGHGRPLHETLSDREFQVLRLLAAGRSVKQIAADLVLSDKTISTYRARILEKMAMTSNAELVRYAVKTGLVD